MEGTNNGIYAMTISYNIGFVPKWYIADLVGKPLAGGYMATFSSLDHQQFKGVYEDPSGTNLWPYVTIPNVGVRGILFDENGSQGPFYFKFDSTNSSDLYYIEIYDSDGVRQWTINNFNGTGSGSGGSIITNVISLQNQVANGVMYRNPGTAEVAPGTFYYIAPGAHSGLALTSSLCGPDIVFIKDFDDATDTISFPKFDLGDTTIDGDIAPVDYLHYDCTVASTTESYKYVQFPIVQDVENLANQTVTISFMGRCTGGTNSNLTIYTKQFFGDGTGASTTFTDAVDTFTLTGSWQKFSVSTTIPDVTGKDRGPCGNDGLFLLFQFPLKATTTMDLTKVVMVIGDVDPDVTFQTYDAIDGEIDNPRTGDIKYSVASSAQHGWVLMNDGLIGSASSGANGRAASDTFPLFNLLWAMDSTYVPMYDSSGNLQARGGSSVADYESNYSITLPKTLGNALATAAPSVSAAQTFTTAGGAGATILTLTSGNAASFGTGSPVHLTNSGGSLPTGLVSGTVYYSVYVTNSEIKLALTVDDAFNLTNLITFDGGSGSGTNSVQLYYAVAGGYRGEPSHLMTSGEVAQNYVTNTLFGVEISDGTGGGSYISYTVENFTNTDKRWTVGNASPSRFNVYQPTVYLNSFIKL